MRSVNRFELKYLVDGARLDALRREVAAHLAPDPNAVGFGPLRQYQVWSCYYDTTGLRCYREKLDGLRNRAKLRVRHHGEPTGLAADTPVWVEIKRRCNRVTEKRRIALPYAGALALCAGRDDAGVAAGDEDVAGEVLAMTVGQALRPVAVVGYSREAWVGDGVDRGLRVTFDRHVRGRDRDLHLRHHGGRVVVDPRLAIVEVKAHDRVPRWLVEAAARHRLEVTRLSKYCATVDAYAGAPRSVDSRDPELDSLVGA